MAEETRIGTTIEENKFDGLVYRIFDEDESSVILDDDGTRNSDYNWSWNEHLYPMETSMLKQAGITEEGEEFTLVRRTYIVHNGVGEEAYVLPVA